jgi:ABC-type glycerol-3-phosphate transport system substrate-binding protein
VNFDWKAIVRTVAPALATALGTPLAGMATKVITDALLGADATDTSEEAIAMAVQSATPDQLIALKQADLQFKKDMAALSVDIEKLANEDRASARQREIATGDQWTPRVLAYLLTVGFFGVLGSVMAWGVPDSARDTVNLLLGSLGTVWLGAMAYYHGTTAGSRAKTEMLAKMEYPK